MQTLNNDLLTLESEKNEVVKTFTFLSFYQQQPHHYNLRILGHPKTSSRIRSSEGRSS